MVPGAPGLNGLSVPSVVEELRPGGDSVTVQPRPTVVQTVRVITLRRDGATLSPAPSQVNYSLVSVRLIIFVTIALPMSGRHGFFIRVGQEVCIGNLNLISGDKTKTLNTTQYNTINLEKPIMISRAEVHGCGCYVIYTGRDGRGRAHFLQHENNIIADIKVRSFRRVRCL